MDQNGTVASKKKSKTLELQSRTPRVQTKTNPNQLQISNVFFNRFSYKLTAVKEKKYFLLPFAAEMDIN